MKKVLVTLAISAKVLALAAAVMLYAGNAEQASAEDCWPCIPPPQCDPSDCES